MRTPQQGCPQSCVCYGAKVSRCDEKKAAERITFRQDIERLILQSFDLQTFSCVSPIVLLCKVSRSAISTNSRTLDPYFLPHLGAILFREGHIAVAAVRAVVRLLKLVAHGQFVNTAISTAAQPIRTSAHVKPVWKGTALHCAQKLVSHSRQRKRLSSCVQTKGDH